MAISLGELFGTIESSLGHSLDDAQKEGIGHGAGPVWIIAGPGTGKTEVLVDRCLKLICVDDVPPSSIMVTTFTEKAATSLQDRLYDHLALLHADHAPNLDSVDLSELHVGTLHGLCNDIMRTHRHVGYQNVRLLDEIEQSLFVYRGRAEELQCQDAIWTNLSYLVGRWDPSRNYPPNRWQASRAAKTLFNRIVEDRLNVQMMRAAGGFWADVADQYDAYVSALRDDHRCDFAHLQKHFLDFLASPRGRLFVEGDGTVLHPGVRHILVDEYQDTNPIQEEIYFRLAEREPHNLTVVGDDDQALYRFRGGTVECMVEFGDRCRARWASVQVERVQLVENHRSHPAIVEACNRYITSFTSMRRVGARAPGKQPLQPAAAIGGTYPAVGLISAQRVRDLPNLFVVTVEGLVANSIVADYSECVLLLRSAQETARYAGPYVDALEAAGIRVYNPRSKAYANREEVAAAMGTFLAVVDPDLSVGQSVRVPGVTQLLQEWTQQYNIAAAANPALADYVGQSRVFIGGLSTDQEIRPAMPTILFRILSFEPFVTWQLDPVRDSRLSKLTRLFEAYCSVVGRPLRTDRQHPGEVRHSWLRSFYYLLVGYLDAAGVDDDEIEEEICPEGRLPIMTIHQAKGLEFPFVFIGALGVSASAGGVHRLEDDLAQFRSAPRSHTLTAQERAEHDLVRMFYVAYSRAQYAMILLASQSQLRATGRTPLGGQEHNWLAQDVTRL